MKKVVTCAAVSGLLAGSFLLGWGGEFEKSAPQESEAVQGMVTGIPRTWVISDLTNPARNLTDKDDQVTMAAFDLLAGKFDIEGITVGATPKGADCADAASWANAEHKVAYSREVGRLQAAYNNYPNSINFKQASTCNEKFEPTRGYSNLTNYGSVNQIVTAAQAGPINVLLWGPLTEAAVLVKHLITTGKNTARNNITFIAHWTAPKSTAHNCFNDADACSYLKDRAADNTIKYYELGDVGQAGLVQNSCASRTMLNKTTMLASEIGSYMDYKWTVSSPNKGMPDMSDSATFWILLGYGGGFIGYTDDGVAPVNLSARRNALCKERQSIFTILQNRANTAAP